MMKSLFKKCSALLLATCALVPAAAAGTIEFSYTVPTDMPLIRGTQSGTHIMRQPRSKAPRLMYVDQGEGSYYKWSNDKREKGKEIEVALFADWWLTASRGKTGAYTKIQVSTENENDAGYVLTSKTQVVKPQPFTIDEVKKNYSVIESGNFAGMVANVVEGEGVSCRIGRIEGDMIVFFKAMNIYYEESIKGIDMDEHGNLRYGPDCASGESSYTGTPKFDAGKMSPALQARFFSYFQHNGFEEQYVEFKTDKGFESIDNNLPGGRKVNLKLEY